MKGLGKLKFWIFKGSQMKHTFEISPKKQQQYIKF